MPDRVDRSIDFSNVMSLIMTLEAILLHLCNDRDVLSTACGATPHVPTPGLKRQIQATSCCAGESCGLGCLSKPVKPWSSTRPEIRDVKHTLGSLQGSSTNESLRLLVAKDC
jgi:hypothetical protein